MPLESAINSMLLDPSTSDQSDVPVRKMHRNSESVTILSAEENDADRIADLISQWAVAGRSADRAKRIREALHRDSYEIFIAKLEGGIVGVLQMVTYPDIVHGEVGSHVLLVLVDKDHRRKGIASKLMRKAIEKAVQQGATKMHVDTTSPEAMRLYQDIGFDDDGVMLCLDLS